MNLRRKTRVVDMNSVKIKKTGNFYSVYENDAYIISYIMKYKLVNIGNDKVKTGFPIYLLDEVLYYLKRNKISYMVDYPKINIDFGSENRYLKCLEKDLPAESLYFNKKPMLSFYGHFSVLFDGDSEIENYEIGVNIESSAELVSKVYEHNINDIIILNSGIRVKIISKEIYKK